jgi:hypothetical protein
MEIKCYPMRISFSLLVETRKFGFVPYNDAIQMQPKKLLYVYGILSYPFWGKGSFK